MNSVANSVGLGQQASSQALSLEGKKDSAPDSEVIVKTANQSVMEKMFDTESKIKVSGRGNADHFSRLKTVDLESPRNIRKVTQESCEREKMNWYLKKSDARGKVSSLSKTDQIPRYDRVFWSISHGNEVTTIFIPNHCIAGNVVFYEVVVSNEELRWNLWVRYSSFAYLNELMKDLVEAMGEKIRVDLPPFPDKRLKALINHFSYSFIENRRALLENYVQKINSHKTLRYAEDFLIFLLPPKEDLSEETGRYPVIMKQSLAAIEEDHKRGDLDVNLNAVENAFTQDNPMSNTASEDGHRGKGKFVLFVNDDDEITGVEINAVSIVDDPDAHHGVYHIVVTNSNKVEGFNKWITMKRFLDFVKFDAEFRADMMENSRVSVARLPHLPPKFSKSLINHTDYAFMEKRRVLLQVYLRWLVRYPVFRRNRLLLEFLGVGKGDYQSVTSGIE